MLYVIYSFIRRDLLEALSYKFDFLFSLTGILVSSSTFFFIAKLFPGKDIPMLAPYGGDYFSFVIIGLAISQLLMAFEKTLPIIIRNAQTTGTLESLFMTRSSIFTILIGLSVYPFLWAMMELFLYFVFGIMLFGAKFGNINWFVCTIILFLGSICFLSLGILSASFIMVFKLGSPFSWIFSSISGLLGGVFFPIKALPGWLKMIAYILPITHTLEGARHSLLTSSSISDIMPNIISLSVFGIIFFPLSIFIFEKALQVSKKHGTLTHY